MAKVHTMMWSNGYNEDAIGDIAWITKSVGGYFAVVNDEQPMFAYSKEPFTEAEANKAFKDWYNESSGMDQDPEWDFDEIIGPLKWKFAEVWWRSVEGLGREATSHKSPTLADLEIDWESYGEYETVAKLQLGDDGWTSKDGYLHIWRYVELVEAP
jgi:hypothetical protein